MTVVVIAGTEQGLAAALDQIFAAYGGVESAIPRTGGTVYVKPNAVHFTPHTHTSPAVLEALLAYLRDHGYRRLAVMESCTGGNFTRLVFRVTGYDRICRRYGAEAVYLDEGPTLQVDLRDGTRARISHRLYEEIVQRGSNVYITLPKLKTHSMAVVTLGVKNQQAFPVDADRMQQHSRGTLHRRLAALYALARPDFCIVDGLVATAHGHFPAQALLEDCLVPMDLLLGGKDTLAVDVVGARVLGYSLDEVEHLRLCAEWGLGVGQLDRIEVRGLPLDRFSQRLPYTLLGRVHPAVRWVVGRDKACVEGCRGNSECIQEMLCNDYDGQGGWTLVCGSGFQASDFDDLPGDILVVGPCACTEAAALLGRRYPGRKIYQVPEHNDLMANTRYQARLMGVRPLDMVPLNPIVSALALLQARLRGLS
ncbi:MAG: DUF362 domain-containing protein, partial [Anaerolineae bacterium]|nr:DUF362 domain-containing protein [Anaerolineae bacterium]